MNNQNVKKLNSRKKVLRTSKVEFFDKKLYSNSVKGIVPVLQHSDSKIPNEIY